MKKTHIIGLVVIALGVGFLIKMLSSEFSRYETFESDYAQAGKEINVVGELEKEMEMYYNPHKDANYFSFYLKDDAGVTKKVVYKGIKPRDFERSEKVVVIGKLEDDEFTAKKILMKCPSKYVETEIVTSSAN
jgi:cytochrome c-type biogenesis protein CcmE